LLQICNWERRKRRRKRRRRNWRGYVIGSSSEDM